MDSTPTGSTLMAEHWRIDAFALWCWRRFLRVPWTARRSNQSILKEINHEYSLDMIICDITDPSGRGEVRAWVMELRFRSAEWRSPAVLEVKVDLWAGRWDPRTYRWSLLLTQGDPGGSMSTRSQRHWRLDIRGGGSEADGEDLRF